jgi:hypothetical protein
MCERAVHVVEAATAIDPVTSLTLVLAALACLLTVLAIIIGLFAIWGYFGIRDSVKEMAEKKVDAAMLEVMKKYPDAADIIKALQRLETTAAFFDDMRNQAVTAPEPKIVAQASKSDVQQEVTEVTRAETPLESTAQQVTPIEQYPGEEKADGDVAKDVPR